MTFLEQVASYGDPVVGFVGFWVAVVAIVFGAVTAIRCGGRRDRSGLVPPDSLGAGIEGLVAGPLIAALVIAIPHLVFGGLGSTRPFSVANYIADSAGLDWVITGVVLLWWYGVLSVMVVGVMRYRQNRRSPVQLTVCENGSEIGYEQRGEGESEIMTDDPWGSPRGTPSVEWDVWQRRAGIPHWEDEADDRGANRRRWWRLWRWRLWRWRQQ